MNRSVWTSQRPHCSICYYSSQINNLYEGQMQKWLVWNSFPKYRSSLTIMCCLTSINTFWHRVPRAVATQTPPVHELTTSYLHISFVLHPLITMLTWGADRSRGVSSFRSGPASACPALRGRRDLVWLAQEPPVNNVYTVEPLLYDHPQNHIGVVV